MRDPDLDGVARAWKIRETEEIAAEHRRNWGYDHASLGCYLVNGPYHPFWSWWYVSLAHLRPIEGAPPAKLHYPEAEYEFAIVSLNPEGRDGKGKNYPPDIEKVEHGGDGLPGFLSPNDVTVQFHGVTDDQARGILDSAVRAIVAGQSCDSDYRQWWTEMVANTVQHVREGKH